MSSPLDPHEREATPAEEAFVTALLADLPRPVMPPEVAARLDAAIAAQAARSTPPPAVPLLPAPRSSRGRTVAAALAGAAAVVVAASVVGTGGLTSVPTVDAAGEAGRSVPTSLSSPQGQASAGLDGALRVLVSGTAYRAGTLADQVSATLRGTGTTAGAPTAAAADLDDTPAETEQRLAGCLESLTGRADAPLSLVDLASYEGRPAALLVVQEGPSVHTAWVVGRECDDDTPALITVRRITSVVVADGSAATAGTPDAPAAPPAPAASPSGT